MKADGTVVFTVRISATAADRARARAEDLGMPLGDYIDQLITQQAPPAFDFFVQQAAFQSMVCAAFSLFIARRALSPDEFAKAQKFANDTALTLYGKAPPRPDDLGAKTLFEDPRMTALFEAFSGR